MVPPINPDRTKLLLVPSPMIIEINPAVTEKRKAAPSIYPVTLLSDFNSFRLKNHQPHKMPKNGKTNEA